MKNSYKTRAMFLLFSIITVINVLMLSMVFFSYSSSIKSDYEEKLSSVASQSSANANLILSLFEEEIEIFINKYNIEETLDSFKIDASNFVRVDSTSFDEIVIFNGMDPVYISSVGDIEFYRDIISDDNFNKAISDQRSRWFVGDSEEKSLNNQGRLIYVRLLFDADTKEKCGYVVASVSTSQLLNLTEGYKNVEEREFLPNNIGISIDGKIFFLGENISKSGKRISDMDDLKLNKNEVCFVNTYSGKNFITIHNTKSLRNKILVVLYLFILIFAVVTLVSYKTLTFLLSEICDRIDKLNCKIEMCSPTKEEKTL